MHPFLRTAVFTVALLCPATGASATSGPVAGPGTIGIRLLDAPTSEAHDPRSAAYIVDRLAPGSVIHRRVEISNTTSVKQPVTLYAGGARIEGGAFIPDAVQAPGELAAWTTAEPTSLDLRPREHHVVMITLGVPADAAPGERYGVMWASTSTPPAKGGGPTVVNRVGIRLYLSVGPGNAPASKFKVDGLVAQRDSDGSPSVLAQVHNTGGRAVDLSGELALSGGPGGTAARTFPVQLGVSLAPGQSAAVTVLVDKSLSDGPWQASLTLRSGLVSQTTATTLRFPRGPGSVAATAPRRRSANPALVLAAAVLTGLLIIASAFQLGRRRRLPSATDHGKYLHNQIQLSADVPGRPIPRRSWSTPAGGRFRGGR